MSYTWQPDTPRADPAPPGLVGRLRQLWRVSLLIMIFGMGLSVFGLTRLFERLSGQGRSLSDRVAAVTLALALRALGLAMIRQGRLEVSAVGTVANHASWLDILALYACRPVTFVSKSEVRGWGALGWLSSIVDTIYVKRDPAAVRAQRDVLAEALDQGRHLVFFPEGTSTDGQRLLPFRAPLFQPFVALGTGRVQPVTITYEGAVPGDRYAWYGGQDFLPHAAEILSLPPGRVRVTLHPAIEIADHAGRKDLAAATRRSIASALPSARDESL